MKTYADFTQLKLSKMEHAKQNLNLQSQTL